MKKNLFVFKTFPINFTNLFLGAVLYGYKNILGSCQYIIHPGGFFTCEHGDTVKKFSSDPGPNSRNLDWSEKIVVLDDLLNQASKQQKVLCFGSHHDTQITYLKNRYQDSCTTVGLSYGPALYQFLLNEMAKYHVFLLKNDLMIPNQSDKEKLISHTYDQLIEWYSNEFDRLNLILPEKQCEFDYDIPIDDFFSLPLLKKHYTELGFDGIRAFKEYYSKWLSSR